MKYTLDVEIEVETHEEDGLLFSFEIIGVTCDGKEIDPPANQGIPWELAVFGVEPDAYGAISVSEDHW